MGPRWTAVGLVVLLAGPGCSDPGDDDSASSDDDTDDDVTQVVYTCTEPVPLGPPVNTEHSEMGPALSPDGLSLFFSSDRPGGEGSADLWMASRASVDDPWQEPVNLGPPVNTDVGQNNPVVSPDGQAVVYGDRTEGDYDLWIAHRLGDGWTEPECIDVLASESKENKPAYTWDGQQLLFKRSDESLVSDIWFSTWGGDGWGEPYLLPGINDERAQTDPAPTPEGDVMFFVQGADTNAPYDVYYALWDGEQWGSITRLDEVSVSGARDEGVFVGEDGREFLLVSNRDDPDDRDLYTFTCERS